MDARSLERIARRGRDGARGIADGAIRVGDAVARLDPSAADDAQGAD
jgi:hypothetical protein